MISPTQGKKNLAALAKSKSTQMPTTAYRHHRSVAQRQSLSLLYELSLQSLTPRIIFVHTIILVLWRRAGARRLGL